MPWQPRPQVQVQFERRKASSNRQTVSAVRTSTYAPSGAGGGGVLTGRSVPVAQSTEGVARAASKRAATSCQLAMFQNAFTQSALTFLYCR